MTLRTLLQPTPGEIWPRMALEYGVAAAALLGFILVSEQIGANPTTAIEMLSLGGTLSILGISMAFLVYETFIHMRFFWNYPDVEPPCETSEGER